MKKGYVYILTNYNRTTFYTGVTNDLERRVIEHGFGDGSKFTKKYKCRYLVYFETFDSIKEAIERECPVFPGITKRLNWPFDNPEAFEGSHEEKLAQVKRVRDEIRSKIEQWIAEVG